jgi:excisionase family DNA binding protein
MKTMGIQEASEFVRVHPVTLSRLAHSGEVPAAKPGKEWVFIDIDLIAWLRSHYQSQTLIGDTTERNDICHSTNVKTRPRGGLISLPQTETEYNKLLALATKSKPKNSMIDLKRSSGNKNV